MTFSLHGSESNEVERLKTFNVCLKLIYNWLRYAPQGMFPLVRIAAC